MFSLKKNSQSIATIEIFEPRDSNDEIKFMDALNELLKEDAFGMIVSITGEKHFSLEAKKDLGIWFKNNKEKLREKCFGFIRIKPNEDESLSKKSLAMKNAMPCPYDVKSTIAKAQAAIKALKSESFYQNQK